MVLLCSTGWSRTCYGDQGGLELIRIYLSLHQSAGIKVCPINPGLGFQFSHLRPFFLQDLIYNLTLQLAATHPHCPLTGGSSPELLYSSHVFSRPNLVYAPAGRNTTEAACIKCMRWVCHSTGDDITNHRLRWCLPGVFTVNVLFYSLGNKM